MLELAAEAPTYFNEQVTEVLAAAAARTSVTFKKPCELP